MKFCLQNYETEKYFRSIDDWTDHWHWAQQFPTPERAMEVAKELRLEKVHLMILTEDGKAMLGTKVV